MLEPLLIDIGANLTNRRFGADLDAVLARAQAAGLVHIVVTGTSQAASEQALVLAKRHPGLLSCTAGVHPHDASQWDDNSAAAITALALDTAVVAVGECGLDYNRMFSPRAAQLACFEAQLNLAVTLRKPVFLHERDAHDDFFALLKQYRPRLAGAVVHCFTGDSGQLRQYLDLDCHIGVTGWVCDERRGDALREAVRYLPLERMMIETDAPYLTPRNLRPAPAGNRNEPMYLPFVLQAVAAIAGIPPAQLALRLHATTSQFFGLATSATN